MLIYVETEADLEKLNDDKFAPYTVLLNPEVFSGHLMDTLHDLGHIAGVILPPVDDESGRWFNKRPAAGYSDDSVCPLDEECSEKWNNAGSGNMWKQFQFYNENTIRDRGSTAK